MRSATFLTVLATSVFSLTGTAWADPSPAATSPAVAATDAANDPNQIICRQGEGVTGTLFKPPAVCHTRREWEQGRQAARKVFDDLNKGPPAIESPGGH